jgi:DNA helicase HerA-like ATPase
VFDEASSALLDQLEVIVKLIRSKGVGVFFCTQNPIDVPDDILAQLGLKVQHALRAFTEKDRKAIKKAAENYPISEFYETEDLITQLGIGEALITALNEKGIPTPLAATICRAPLSRMDVLEQNEVDALVAKSTIAAKYNEEIDRESAYEILTGKIERAATEEKQAEARAEQEKAEELLREKQAKLREQEAKEREKELKRLEREEARREREEIKELERLRKAQEREAKREARERERMWKDVTQSVTKGATSSRGGGWIGELTRGLLGILKGK